MKSDHSAYDHVASVTRIDTILAGSDLRYSEAERIPAREQLGPNNGFYVNCSALFIDLRGSSALPREYKQRTLAKIYRAYISESVAVINANPKCAEIMIVGDAVSAVFDTRSEAEIDSVFQTAARLNSLIQLINCRLQRYSLAPIRAGIGLAWGQALMIKAGAERSRLDEVVWMGDVVNRASKLCKLASRDTPREPIVVDRAFGDRLNKEYRETLTDSGKGHYTADVINVGMNAWRSENCG